MKNIREYGAKGNGLDDDASAVQTAINDGGAYFPTGTYRIKSSLTLKSGAILQGRGARIIAPVFIQNAIVIQDGAQNIILDGMKFQCTSHTVLKSLGAFNRLKIIDCDFVGKLPTTNFLVNLTGVGKNLRITNSSFTDGLYPIELKTNVQKVRITDNYFTRWLHYAISLRDAIEDITIEANDFGGQVAGIGGARQMIVCLGTANAKINRIYILRNICRGTREFWDPTSATTLASGDQIVLHYCENFEVNWNHSFYGGENGISIVQKSKNGTVIGNQIYENDAHGLQVSEVNYISSGVIIAQNHIYNNGLRGDGKPDVMSQLYLQDAEDCLIEANIFEDKFQPRKAISGINMALCKNITIPSTNQFNWTDPAGYSPILNFSPD